MSILNKFLIQSAIVTSLVAVSLVAMPAAEARDNRGKSKISKQHNGKRMAIASRNNSPRVMNNNRSNRSASNNNTNNHRVNVRNNRRPVANNRQRYKAPVHRRINNSYNTYNSYNRYNRSFKSKYDRRYRYSSRNRYNNGSFITGLVGGAFLYSALNNNYGYGYSSYNNSGYAYAGYGYPNYGYSNYNSYNTPRTKIVYVDRPIVQQVPVQTPVAYTNQAQQQATDPSCLQVREYTTDINIGNQTVPAYGQACLQPDGSWKFGEAIPVPNF